MGSGTYFVLTVLLSSTYVVSLNHPGGEAYKPDPDTALGTPYRDLLEEHVPPAGGRHGG